MTLKSTAPGEHFLCPSHNTNVREESQYPQMNTDNPNQSHPFIQVYNSVIFSPKLSAKARILYAALVNHAIKTDVVWPSQETLAKLVGCSARHVRTLMKELIEEGLVKILKRGYWKRATEYLLTSLVRIGNNAVRPASNMGNSRSYQPYTNTNNINNRANRRFEKKKEPEIAGAVAYFRRLGLQT